ARVELRFTGGIRRRRGGWFCRRRRHFRRFLGLQIFLFLLDLFFPVRVDDDLFFSGGFAVHGFFSPWCRLRFGRLFGGGGVGRRFAATHNCGGDKTGEQRLGLDGF